MNLKGKVALVTGAGGGMGEATARRFAADGAQVCINDIEANNLEKIVSSLPKGSAIACAGDVTKEEDVKRMVETTVSRFGKLNILVNSAGIDPPEVEADYDLDLWHRILEVNLTGTYLTTKISVPHMIKAGYGSIVNIASLAGVRFLPMKTAYSSSKGGLIALSQQTAVQYGPNNVRCNVICPGGVRTPMLEFHVKALAQRIGKDIEWLLANSPTGAPLGRMGKPEEIASICSFLASEDSILITGGIIMADGGLSAVDPHSIAARGFMNELGISPTPKK
jgi:meso-butanediol dehydrogenase / (S,S)-butanediol dehydrogenase / diacetyl reductase